MQRRQFLTIMGAAALTGGCQTSGLDSSLRQAIGGGGFAGLGPLTDGEIGRGLKEALKVGTGRVVRQVGAEDGYNGDPLIRIPLPKNLQKVHNVLKRVGAERMTADLALKLNRAAERAAPEAREVFWQAILEMTLDDVRGIWKGEDDAATRYFRGKMTNPLTERFTPIVADSMSQVGAIRSYDKMMAKYKSVPFVPDVKTDLTRHVVGKGIGGIFHYVGKEEAAIRKDPAKRSTALLRRVFGSAQG